jgi:3-oxo-5-alpha-steroid 4-dehydrogenase 3
LGIGQLASFITFAQIWQYGLKARVGHVHAVLEKLLADIGKASLEKHTFVAEDFLFTGPSLRTFIGVILFLLASGMQYDCHAYLASLKRPRMTREGKQEVKYRMPEHPAWNLCLTPHYFAECLIYLSMSIVAAPKGSLINWTLGCALIFVVVNLGITASGTKRWYEHRFGASSVAGRSCMIPFVY